MLHIPAGTMLRVETHHDGSLTLRFDSRKRPLDPETTAIEATEDADVTADMTAGADNDVAFTLKRHKTAVFDAKMALAKSLVALQGNDARTTAIERMFIARCEDQQGDDLIEGHRKFIFTLSPQRDRSFPSPKHSTRRSPRSRWAIPDANAYDPLRR